jgi:excisionase family DNA binding protein
VLSVKQAADAMGISSTLVYALCQAKKIRHERHGLGRGTIRIPEGAINEYRERCTVAITGAKPLPPRVRLKHINLSPSSPARANTPSSE